MGSVQFLCSWFSRGVVTGRIRTQTRWLLTYFRYLFLLYGLKTQLLVFFSSVTDTPTVYLRSKPIYSKYLLPAARAPEWHSKCGNNIKGAWPWSASPWAENLWLYTLHILCIKFDPNSCIMQQVMKCVIIRFRSKQSVPLPRNLKHAFHCDDCHYPHPMSGCNLFIIKKQNCNSFLHKSNSSYRLDLNRAFDSLFSTHSNCLH